MVNILLRDLTLRFVTCQCFYIHSIQITKYNISGVNVAIVALNCFVNYAKVVKSVNVVWKLRSASILYTVTL